MNKLFTFALAAAFSSSAVEAQILKYGAEAGETAPDTVNWYGNWVDAGGSIEFGNKDAAATGEGGIYVYNPEEAGTANDWERVLKFDGLKIKANTNYRVRVSAMIPSNAIVGLALMCGDENCDMPFVLPTDGGYYSQKKDLSGFNDGEFKTKAALFHYTTDEYQQEIYPKVKADDKNPLGANRFLRLTVKSVGEYYLDDVIVEEAPIAACYNNNEAIKVDFGFKTNIAELVKANGADISLPVSCAKVKIDGKEVEIMAVELKKDGNLYIFPDVDSIDDEAKIEVSFDATNSGIKYSGAETPGDGLDVPSFENEASYLDLDFDAVSTLFEEPILLSSDPKDASFELDETLKEFTFNFNKNIFVSGKNAPVAVLEGGNIKGKVKLNLKESAEELGTSVTFTYDGAQLKKGTYYVTLSDVQSEMGVDITKDITIMFETGKVSVAEIEYTDVELIDVKGENGNHSENWTSYFNGEEVVPAGSGIRMFDFPADGKYTKGFYLSQRDAENGTALTYGEKEDAPFNLPAGDVQINILASAWQGNTGGFLYELLNEAGDVVASGNGNAEIHIENQGTPANDVSKISFNVEGCKAGKYVLRLTTKTGGYGNAIIVWGIDTKTYKVGQGETADNQVLVDGSFAGVGNDCTPDEGAGWTVYEIRNGETVPVEKGSSNAIGQRARFFAYSNCPNLPVAYYNRNMGGVAETSYYMTFGETAVGEPELILDEVRYNFSWYCVNWKGDNNKYYFQILDAEDGSVVYDREDDITPTLLGNRDTSVEPTKIEFAWTAPHYGAYILKWFMDGESSLGNIKVEQMGSMAVFWHTQLNNAIALAEDELQSASGDEYAGTTRDELEAAIKEAKTVTFHTGEEYTAAIEGLALKVKAMASRRGAVSDYQVAYDNLAAQVENMSDTKYENLDSYKKAAGYIAKYEGVAGYTIPNDELLPLVEDMKTLRTLNINLMAENTGVAVLTNQVENLAKAYVKLDQFINGDESMAEVEEVILKATDETVTDDQELAALLKKMVTSALYKAIDKGYDFMDLEFPEDEPSEDNPYVPSDLDLTGYIQNAKFYSLLPQAKPQPTTQAESDGTMPGWEFNAPNGYAADWGWGGWSNNNIPVAPANVANSQAGTRWGTDFEIFQLIDEIPVGIYTIGAKCCDRSFVEGNGVNTLAEGAETPSTLYVKQEGKDDLTMPFDVTSIGEYYGMSETLFNNVTIDPVEGGVTGQVTLGANVIFFGPQEMQDATGVSRDGFASIDDAMLKMSAKHPTFDYAAAAKVIDEQITAVKSVETGVAGTAVKTQYFDANGRQVAQPAKGIYVRIDTMADGSQRAVKVLRR
ncbi:MAG: hypothetical protein KBT29_07335 [Prevotellaceae bacterium]|nr:hypothetical protein [Candidatus Minthosoma caballi]